MPADIEDDDIAVWVADLRDAMQLDEQCSRCTHPASAHFASSGACVSCDCEGLTR